MPQFRTADLLRDAPDRRAHQVQAVASRLDQCQRRVLAALGKLQEDVGGRKQIVPRGALHIAVPEDVPHAARKLREVRGVDAPAGKVELDARGFAQQLNRPHQGLAALFALEPRQEQDAQRSAFRETGRLHRRNIHGIADNLDARPSPSVSPVQLHGRARRRRQHPNRVLERSMVERVDAAEAAQFWTYRAVAALHGGARAQQVAVVQRVNYRGVSAGHLPGHGGKAVDVMGVDRLGPYAAQHLVERGDGGRVPEIHGMPGRPHQPARRRRFAVEPPVEIERRDAPDPDALPFADPIPAAVEIPARARRDDIHLLSQAPESEGQLGGRALRASHGVRGEQ